LSHGVKRSGTRSTPVAVYERALSDGQIAQHYALRTSRARSGSGALRCTVGSNPLAAIRSTTVSVAGTNVTVAQDPVSCSGADAGRHEPSDGWRSHAGGRWFREAVLPCLPKIDRR
jgi:hypothetical protein